MIKSRDNLIGAYAFLVGIVLALGVGIIPALTGQSVNMAIKHTSTVYALLAISGILVGIFNAGGKNSNTFLLAAVSVVISSYMGLSSIALINNIFIVNINIGLMFTSTFNALLMLFIPATIIVALKSVFAISSV